jgi:hypothetical protein
MGLKDSLRKMEEQGRDATRRVLGQAREQWEDAERRIRANMRIHPRPKQNSTTAKSSFAAQPSTSHLNAADSVLDDNMSKAPAAEVPKTGKVNTSVREAEKKDVA